MSYLTLLGTGADKANGSTSGLVTGCGDGLDLQFLRQAGLDAGQRRLNLGNNLQGGRLAGSPDPIILHSLIPSQGQPVSAGVFNTDAHGNGQVLLPSLPRGLAAKAFAVTVEPNGGVAQPTGPKVLIGLVPDRPSPKFPL